MKISYTQALKKLEQYGQEHILRYYDELEEAGKEELLGQIAETDFSVLDSLKEKDKGVPKGKITPLGAMELTEIEADREHYYQIGMPPELIGI